MSSVYRQLLLFPCRSSFLLQRMQKTQLIVRFPYFMQSHAQGVFGDLSPPSVLVTCGPCPENTPLTVLSKAL